MFSFNACYLIFSRLTFLSYLVGFFGAIKNYFFTPTESVKLYSTNGSEDTALELPNFHNIDNLPAGIKDQELCNYTSDLSAQELGALVAASFDIYEDADTTPEIPAEYSSILADYHIINTEYSYERDNSTKSGLHAVAFENTKTNHTYAVICGLETNDVITGTIPDLGALGFDGLETQTRLASQLVKDLEADHGPCTIIGQSMGTIIADTLRVIQQAEYPDQTIPNAITIEQRTMGTSLYEHVTALANKIAPEYTNIDYDFSRETMLQHVQPVITLPNNWNSGRVSSLFEGQNEFPDNTIMLLTAERIPQVNNQHWYSTYRNLFDLEVFGSHRCTNSMTALASGEAELYFTDNLPNNMAEMLYSRGLMAENNESSYCYIS